MAKFIGLRPPVSATLSMLGPHYHSSWISHCCPVLWRSHRFGSVGQLLHMLQQVMDGMDVGKGQVLTLGLGLGSYRIGLPGRKWGRSPMFTASANFGTAHQQLWGSSLTPALIGLLFLLLGSQDQSSTPAPGTVEGVRCARPSPAHAATHKTDW